MSTSNKFIDEQRELLNKCVIRFKFVKADGTDAEAVGTTNLKFIPADKHPKNPGAVKQNQIAYFDLEKNDWRSMQLDAPFIVLNMWKSLPKKYQK